MIVRVEKHTTGYSIIDNTGLNDDRLSLKARGLLGYLLTKPDTWEVTVQGIIAQVPDGRDAVQSGLKELERFGYAEYRTVRVEGGRLYGKKWVIFERPAVKAGDNQPVTSSSSDHRQTGFPIFGKTDFRKNRFSEKRLQVNTDYVVNTDYPVITKCTRGGKKNRQFKDDVPPSSPPISGAPPRAVLFSEAGWTIDSWTSEFCSRFPGCNKEDAAYYYERCMTWANKNSAKSKDWISTAGDFMSGDTKRKQTKKPDTHGTSNFRDNKAIVDPVRAIQRASRFAQRNNFKIGSPE